MRERIQTACKVLRRQYEDWGKGFLYDYQKEAIEKLNSGMILQGGTGCGKSRTGLYWYFRENGGVINGEHYGRMVKPKDLYIITTATKRNKREWDMELIPFGLVVERKRKKGETEVKSMYPGMKVIVDSWQNIAKYENVENAYFIFDEDHVVSFGAWTISFIKISQNNKWIVMTATPADKWCEYAPVFVACGFYRNKTDFNNQHVIFDPYFRNYPKIKGYFNTGKLIRLRNKITVQIEYKNDVEYFDTPILCEYDAVKYNYLMRDRFDPWKEEPIQNASGLCYCLRRVCNENMSRVKALEELLLKHKRIIVFYNYDYELDILKGIDWSGVCGCEVKVAELNGHAHDELPSGEYWIYLCQYNAGAEAWNCISTNVIVFYSQTYSYKTLVQAKGRIDRRNTPFVKLYYYHFLSNSVIDRSIKNTLRAKKKFNETNYLRKMGIEF